MWLVFALSAAVCFSIVHVLDSYCVKDVFDRPWMGVITSAIGTVVVYLPLPYILPFVEWQWSWSSWQVISLALLAGALIQISQFMYFNAMAYSEAGIIAAYWNMIPVILSALGFILFHEVLSLREYIGILILITSSSYMLLLDSTLKTRMISFSLMLVASCVQAFYYIIQNHVYEQIPFLQGFYLFITGYIIAGIAPLIFARIRNTFISNLPTLLPTTRIIIFIEVANIFALLSAQGAVSLGIPSLVSAIETTMPAFTFILSLLLYIFTRRMGDSRSKIRLFQKGLAVCLMTYGVWLLS